MEIPNSREAFKKIAREVEQYSQNGDVVSLKRELVKMRDMIVDVLDYSFYFELFYPIFNKILSHIPVQNQRNDFHFCRKTVLEIIQRIPLAPNLSRHANELMTLCTKILQSDNEENAIIVIKLIMEIHKKFKKYQPSLEKYVNEFLDFVKVMYGNFPKIVELMMDPNGPEDTTIIPQAKDSCRVLTECPLLVVFLFQAYQNPGDNNNLHELLQSMIDSFNEDSPSYDPKNDRLRDNYCALVSCKVKTASFLAYTLRVYNKFISEHRDAIPKIVTDLLLSCPRSSIQARKELLVIMRHMIDSRNSTLRNYFVPYIEQFLDDENLTMKNKSAHESMRPLAYSTLADLIHHVRNQLTLGLIAKTVTFYTRVMFDSTLKVAIQTMSAKLLVHLVESIFISKDKHQGLSILLHIMESFIYKIQSLSVFISDLLIPDKEVTKVNELKELPYDMTRQKITKENEGRIKHQCKTMVKTLILGLKNVVYVIHNLEKQMPKKPPPTGNPVTDLQREREERAKGLAACEPRRGLGNVGLNPDLSLAEGGTEGGSFEIRGRIIPFEKKRLFRNLFKNGIRCFLIYELTRENIPAEAKENLDSFASLFTVLSGSSFQVVLKELLPMLYEQILQRKIFLQIPTHFLSSQKLSKVFLKTILDFVIPKMKRLSGSTKEAKIILTFFKLIFMSVVAIPSNEAVLRPYMGRIIRTCVKNSSRAVESYNYLHVLRSMFRAISQGKFDQLTDHIAPNIGLMLGKFDDLLRGTQKSQLRDMLVELCLTVPAKLHVLCPHLPKLILPVLYSMDGSKEMVVFGMRNLEYWVASFKSNSIEPVLRPILPKLLMGLFSHLKPKPDLFGTPALKLLAKMGSLARAYALNPPPMQVKEHMYSCKTRLLFRGGKKDQIVDNVRAAPYQTGNIDKNAGSKKKKILIDPMLRKVLDIDEDDDDNELKKKKERMKDEGQEEVEGEDPDPFHVEEECEEVPYSDDIGFEFTLDPYIRVARRIIYSPRAKPRSKLSSMQFLQKLLGSILDLEGSVKDFEIPEVICSSRAHFILHGEVGCRSTTYNPYVVERNGIKKTQIHVHSEENVFRFLLATIFEMMSLKEETIMKPFLEHVLRHFALLFVSKCNQIPLTGRDLRLEVVLDAIVSVLQHDYVAAVAVLKGLFENMYVICNHNKQMVSSLVIWEKLLQRLTHSCHHRDWKKKVGGCKGMQCLCEHLTAEWMVTRQNDVVNAIIFTVKESQDYDTAVVECSTETLKSYIKLCHSQFLQRENKNGLPFGKMDGQNYPIEGKGIQLYNLCKVLISELSSGTITVRDIVREVFEYISGMSGQPVALYLGQFRAQLVKSLNMKRFDNFPQRLKRGFCEALTYFLRIRPAFLPINDSILDIIERSLKFVELLNHPKRKQLSEYDLVERENLEVSCLRLIATSLNSQEMFPANLVNERLKNVRQKIFDKMYSCIMGTLSNRNYEVVRICKKGILDYLKVCDESVKTLLYSRVTQLLTSLVVNTDSLQLEQIKKVSNMLELASPHFSNMLFSTLVDHLEKWVNPALMVSPSRGNQKEKVHHAKRIVELFHYLPYCPDREGDVGKIIGTVMKMEKSFSEACHELFSPFRLPLAMLCAKYPRGTLQFLFSPSQFGNVNVIECRQLFYILMSMLRYDEFNPVSQMIMGEDEKYINIMIPYLNDNSGSGETRKDVELELRVILVIYRIMRKFPRTLIERNGLLQAVLMVWRSHMYQLRLLSSNSVEIRRIRIMLKIFMMHYDALKDEGEIDAYILFEILICFSDRTAIDYTFVVGFLRRQIVEFTPQQRQDIVYESMRLFEERRNTARIDDSMSEIFEYLVLPGLKFTEREKTILDWVDEKMLEDFIPFLLKYERDFYYESNAFHVKVVKVLTLLVNYVPDLMHNYRKNLLQYVQFFAKLQRVTFKHCLLLLGSFVVQRFEFEDNKVLSMFEKMLKCEYPDGKAIIQQGLDLVLPVVEKTKSMSQELPGYPLWISITRRACIEEGYCGPTMNHIWLFVMSHHKPFYPYRKIFVNKMVNSLARISVSQNLSYENRKLGLNVANLSLDWQFNVTEDEEDFLVPEREKIDVLDRTLLRKRKFELTRPKQFFFDKFDERGELSDTSIRDIEQRILKESQKLNKRRVHVLLEEENGHDKMMDEDEEGEEQQEVQTDEEKEGGDTNMEDEEKGEEKEISEPPVKKRKTETGVEEIEEKKIRKIKPIDLKIARLVMDFTLNVSRVINHHPPMSKLTLQQIRELSDLAVKIVYKCLSLIPKEKKICSELVRKVTKGNYREEVATEGVRILKIVVKFQRELVQPHLDEINKYSLRLLESNNPRVLKNYVSLLREITAVWPVSQENNPEVIRKFYIRLFENVKVGFIRWERSLRMPVPGEAIPQTRGLFNMVKVYGYMKILTTLCHYSPRNMGIFTTTVRSILGKLLKIQSCRSTHELQIKEHQAQNQIQDQIRTRSQLSLVRKQLLREITKEMTENVPVILLCLRFLSDVTRYRQIETFYSYLMFFSQILERNDFFNVEIVREALRHLKAWMCKREDFGIFNFSPKLMAYFLSRMAKFQHEGHDKRIRSVYFRILGELYSDHDLMSQTGYLPTRVESMFMNGCSVEDKNTVRFVVSTINRNVGKSLVDRMTFISQSEHWRHLRGQFWVTVAGDLLLDVCEKKFPFRLLNFSRVFSPFKKRGDIYEEIGIRSLHYNPNNPVIAKGPYRTALLTAPNEKNPQGLGELGSPMGLFPSTMKQRRSVYYEVPSENRRITGKLGALLTEHEKFMNSMKGQTLGDLVTPLRDICFEREGISKEVWVELFVGAWNSLSGELQRYFHKPLLVLLARDYHSAQYVKYPNVIQALLEGVAAIRPHLPISPEQLRFLGKSFNCWNVVLPWIEEKLDHIFLNPDLYPYDVKERFTTSLTELYRTLGEEDMLVGVWRRFGIQKTTKLLFALENNDRWNYAQKYLHHVFRMYQDGVMRRHDVTHPEISLWEDAWMKSSKRLQQWEDLLKFSKEVKMKALLLESEWNIGKWDHVDEMIKHPTVARSSNIHIYQMGFSIMKNNFSEAVEYFNTASQSCLQRWCALPNFHCRTHLMMIHSFQQLVELYESSRLVGDNVFMVSHKLGSFFLKWNDRFPSQHDDIEMWSDIILWRYHFLEKMGICSIPSVPKIHCLKEGFIQLVKFVSVMRRKKLPDSARLVLKKSENLIKFQRDKLHIIFQQAIQEIKILISEERYDDALKVIDTQPCLKNLSQNKREIQVLRLKGVCQTHLGQFEAARSCFSRAIGCFPEKYISINEANVKLGNVFHGWAKLLDKMYEVSRKNKENADHTLDLCDQTITCYMQAIRFKSKHMREIPRVLFLCSRDRDQKLFKTMERCLEDIPHWVFIPWIDHLFSMCQNEVEYHVARRILLEIDTEFPHSIYFGLRSFFFNVRDTMMKIKQQGPTSSSQAMLRIHPLGPLKRRVEEIMSKLLQSHPPLIHEVEGILKEMQVRLKPELEEELLRSFQMLLGFIYDSNIRGSCPEYVTRFVTQICRVYFPDPTKDGMHTKRFKRSNFIMGHQAEMRRDFDGTCGRKEYCEAQRVLAAKRHAVAMAHASAIQAAQAKGGKTSVPAPPPVPQTVNVDLSGYLLRDLVKITKKWITKLLALLHKYPQVVPLESISRLMILSQLKEFEVPGQYERDYTKKPYPESHIKLLHFLPSVYVVRRNRINCRMAEMRTSNGEKAKFSLFTSPAIGHYPCYDQTEERLFNFIKHVNLFLLQYSLPFHVVVFDLARIPSVRACTTFSTRFERSSR